MRRRQNNATAPTPAPPTPAPPTPDPPPLGASAPGFPPEHEPDEWRTGRARIEGDGSAGGDPNVLGPGARAALAGLDMDALRASRLGRGEGPVVAERRAMIARLLNAGAPRGVIVETIGERFGLAVATCENEITRVRSERADLFEAERKHAKSEQVARLGRDLAEMRSLPSKPWKAIANHEGLLAKITGTIEPMRVDVNMNLEVTNALAIFVGRLGAEEIEAMVAEQACLESGDPLALPAVSMTPASGRITQGARAGWTAGARKGNGSAS